MRITTINDEASLDDLIDRVHGSGASKKKEVRERFLAMNPHLADFHHLPPGTPVVLPSDSAAAPAPDPRAQNAIALSQQAVSLTRAELDAGAARSAATAKATAELLNDPTTVKAIQANHDAGQRRGEVLKALKSEEAQWNSARDEINHALAGFEETLKKWTAPAEPPVEPDKKGSPSDDQPPAQPRRPVGKK